MLSHLSKKVECPQIVFCLSYIRFDVLTNNNTVVIIEIQLFCCIQKGEDPVKKCETYFRYNICFARKKYNLTQKQMAQILGIGVDKLRRIEKNDPSVRLNDRMVIRFCDYFGVKADFALLKKLE